MAEGTGWHEGDSEVMEWVWSVAGRGTSVRVTERVNDSKLIVTETYTLPDGSVMKDRVHMTRTR